MRGDERAVSDLVGFVLTFALVLASVGIVATVGFDQISEARDQEQIRNSQQGMIELAESFDYVNQRTDVKRTAGLGLSEGTLQFQRSELEVTVDPPSASPTSETIETGALAHRLDEYEVAYEGGAVFSGSGRIVEYQPAISCRGDTAIVSVLTYDVDDVTVRSTTGGRESVDLIDSGGADAIQDGVALQDASVISDEGAVLVEATYEPTESTVVTRRSFDSGTATVSVDYSGAAYPDGWEQFGNQVGGGWSVSGDTLECSGVSQILVRETAVSLSLGDT
jgi:hypothetical protein